MIGEIQHMEYKEYEEKILQGLTEKYNRDFEIVELTYEVSGRRGDFYRAACREVGGERIFNSYYYPNATNMPELTESIENFDKKPELTDEYSETALNVKFEEYLVRNIDGVILAIADTDFGVYPITFDEVCKGVTYCLFDGNIEVDTRIKLFADKSIADKPSYEKVIINGLLKSSIMVMSVDFVYIDEINKDMMNDKYHNNTYMFRDRIVEDNCTERCVWYIVQKNRGIIKVKEIKGGEEHGVY